MDSIAVVLYVMCIVIFWVIKAVAADLGKKKPSRKQSYTTKQSFARTQNTGYNRSASYGGKKTTYSTGKTSFSGLDQKTLTRFSDEIQKRTAKYRNGYSDFDSRSLEYCDSMISRSEGITFHGLPEGADELAYLARYNNRREKEIERQMHHSHFDE